MKKIDIKDKVYDEINQFCKSNNIEDVNKFINKILNQGFAAEKWGSIGPTQPKIIEKIIISAVTQEQQIIHSENNNILKTDTKVTKTIDYPIDDSDFYGEKKLRQL